MLIQGRLSLSDRIYWHGGGFSKDILVIWRGGKLRPTKTLLLGFGPMIKSLLRLVVYYVLHLRVSQVSSWFPRFPGNYQLYPQPVEGEAHCFVTSGALLQKICEKTWRRKTLAETIPTIIYLELVIKTTWKMCVIFRWWKDIEKENCFGGGPTCPFTVESEVSD